MFKSLFIAFIPFIVALLTILFTWRWLIKKVFTTMMKIVMNENYHDNLLEMLPLAKRIGLVPLVENQLRTAEGKLLYRPLGSAKKWPDFDSITFIPAQTTPFPIDKEEQIDLSRTIGRFAKKPLHINIPIMIGGMAYGLALSKEAKIALAKASAKMKTAINSGEGAVLPEEREAAYKFILQFSKTTWGKEEHLIKSADMIEIKLGQGALAGLGDRIPAANISDEAKSLMELDDDEDAIIYEHFFENQTVSDLKQLVSDLREASGGAPIGVKIMTGGQIEDDLDRLIEMNVDFINIDGGQAATYGAPPILQDDFGIPTLHAIVRANRHLRRRKMKERISLIASGGLHTPGDMLKAIALGADLVYIGSAIMLAINHNQMFKPMPWEPPSQMIWSTGAMNDDFNIEQGAEFGYQYLNSCVEEMKIALRAMGKNSLKELSDKDLVSYNEKVAKMAHIAYSFSHKKEP